MVLSVAVLEAELEACRKKRNNLTQQLKNACDSIRTLETHRKEARKTEKLEANNQANLIANAPAVQQGPNAQVPAAPQPAPGQQDDENN